jgi:predicted nucleic-acid-binding protein
VIAIDTNVLLQYLVPDNPEQSEKARRLIDETCSPQDPALINFVSLAETWWVLRRLRKVSKPDLVMMFDELLANECLAFPDTEVVVSAMAAYAEGAADFPDYLIFFDNHRLGADRTVTFDKNAARASFMTLIG